MIRSMKEFFEQLIEPETRQPGGPSEHALQVATAALLLEVTRLEGAVTEEEREAVTRALRTRFELSDAEVDTLVALAEAEARDAPGYHPFTSRINKGFSAEQKVRMVEYMWQVAYADGHLDAHEQHFLRKIADLLYVSHRDYIAAKMRAREAAGLESPFGEA